MADSLFRSEALAHTTAGERYDDLFVVVPAQAWAILAAVGVLLAAVLGWALFATIPVTVDGSGVLVAGAGIETLTAPADGVVEHERPAGAAVAADEAVLRLRTAAMTIASVRSPIAGTIIEVAPEPGAFVHRGDVVATLEPPRTSLQAVVFLPVAVDTPVAPGMAARISPVDADSRVYGTIRGTLSSVAPYPATPERIAAVLHNAALAAGVPPGALREVHVALTRDAAGEPAWSGAARARPHVASGTPCTAGVVVEWRRPIAFIFPPLR